MMMKFLEKEFLVTSAAALIGSTQGKCFFSRKTFLLSSRLVVGTF
jgi:hypothetical protein